MPNRVNARVGLARQLMGHVRIGRLPKRYGWPAVIAALSSTDTLDDDLLRSASVAAGSTLAELKSQESLAYTYWLFLQLALASRDPDPKKAFGQLGVRLPDEDSGMAFLAGISSTTAAHFQEKGWISVTDDLALQSFRAAVSDLIAEESQSLFGSTIDGVLAAFKRYSTRDRVAHLGRRFFGEYTFRVLDRALARQLASSLVTGKRFATSEDLNTFRTRLRTYCWDVSKLVEAFAGGWYSKHAWLGDIDMENTRNFTSYALEKVLSEAVREEPAL